MRVFIHENVFQYQARGLEYLLDCVQAGDESKKSIDFS
jgi:hypothetical protein